MNKTLTYITFALASILYVQGCSSDFGIDVQSDAKLYLQCFPGARDTTIIQLYRTIPVGTVYKGSEFLDDASIEFRVNGVLKEVFHTDEMLGSVPPGCWYVKGSLHYGDQIELSANANEVKAPVSAKTAIPARMPSFTHEFIRPDAVTFSFKDDPDTEDYYGAIVVYECAYDNDKLHVVKEGCCAPDKGAEGLWGMSLNSNYLDVPFNGWAYGYFSTTVRMWSDESFSGENVTLAFQFSEPWFQDLVDENRQPIECTQTLRRKLVLYRFSKEFYNYAVMMDNVENNMFASLGMAPAAFAYSNVTCGVGIFAGYTVAETEWIDY